MQGGRGDEIWQEADGHKHAGDWALIQTVGEHQPSQAAESHWEIRYPGREDGELPDCRLGTGGHQSGVAEVCAGRSEEDFARKRHAAEVAVATGQKQVGEHNYEGSAKILSPSTELFIYMCLCVYSPINKSLILALS